MEADDVGQSVLVNASDSVGDGIGKLLHGKLARGGLKLGIDGSGDLAEDFSGLGHVVSGLVDLFNEADLTINLEVCQGVFENFSVPRGNELNGAICRLEPNREQVARFCQTNLFHFFHYLVRHVSTQLEEKVKR